MDLEAVTNLIIVMGAIALGLAVVMSWLGSIHHLDAPRLISSGWFALPAWAQVVFGFAAIAFFIWFGFLLWIPLPLRLPELVILLTRSVGLIIFLIGLFLALWARWALGTMYGVSTGSSAPLQEKHRLIQRGPYAFIRHPMYLGYWLLLLGVTLIFRTWTPFVFLMICLPLSRRAQREEKALAEKFADEWRAYVARVPRFVPRALLGAKRGGETKR